MHAALTSEGGAVGAAEEGAGSIDVIATTMSGSVRDQRQVGRIGPEFRAGTAITVRVHIADSHDEAREIAQEIVRSGGRTLVSAGGAGTFNAVLRGALASGEAPPGLRLAFLRKGSADLIGKVLEIPDDLEAGVRAVLGGLKAGCSLEADVLTVSAASPTGDMGSSPLVGFGGVGVFGEVPRFTESRFVKLYKGVLGTLLGDYGPFYVGLALALISWHLQLLLGRVPPMELEFDGETTDEKRYSAVIFVNGDLGDSFPLATGMPLGEGTFRVIALAQGGVRQSIRQLTAARGGRLAEEAATLGAEVRTVRQLTVRPTGDASYLVNVDGVRMPAQGATSVAVTGCVSLVVGHDPAG